MEWYFILLIIVGGLLVLVCALLVIRKLTQPKFKKAKKYLEQHAKIEKVEQQQEEVAKGSPIGLNLDSVYADEEESLYSQDDEEINNFDFEKFDPPKVEKKKSLLEQIRELSPELKMLIFDRGLARKDYDFKSKKD